MAIFMTLKREWRAIDGSDPGNEQVKISVGRHEMEQIKNPFGYKEGWLVLKGTKIGATECYWRSFSEEDFGDYRVVIEEFVLYPVIDAQIDHPFQVIVISEGFVPETSKTELPAGEYRLEPIGNPCSKTGYPWYIIAGTNQGLPLDEWEKVVKDWPL